MGRRHLNQQQPKESCCKRPDTNRTDKMQNQPDTFICHASEDKAAIALPLHEALTQLGVHSWLDESEIRLGQSIRQKIDEGLVTCRSATIILSRPFFAKNWPQYEMDGIVGRAMEGEISLFPIQHGITIQEIRDHSPSLAGLSLWNTAERSPEEIADEIAGQLGIGKPATTEQSAGSPSAPAESPTTPPTARTFGTFYIAPAGTGQLPPGSEPKPNPMMVFSTPTGWIPMVNNNEELEYVMEANTLRLRLDWGNQWTGSEMQAAQMVSQGEPFALTIPDGWERTNLPTPCGQLVTRQKHLVSCKQPFRMDDVPNIVNRRARRLAPCHWPI